MARVEFEFTNDADLGAFFDVVRRGMTKVSLKPDTMFVRFNRDKDKASWVTQIPVAENKPQSVMGWELHPPEGIREAVGQAIGRGSACWSNPSGAGVFQSRDAEGVVNELIDWLYSEWLPGQLHEYKAKNDAAINEMSMDPGSQKSSLDVPRHFDVTVEPTRVRAKVGDRPVGTFASAQRAGYWNMIAPRLGITYQSLAEAIHAAMQAAAWEDLTDVPISLQWNRGTLAGTRVPDGTPGVNKDNIEP